MTLPRRKKNLSKVLIASLDYIQSCANVFAYRAGKIKTQADAVVIGGGALGCSVAYHLSGGGPGGKKVGDVVLLEKTELTAGSTWHAAGIANSMIKSKRINSHHLAGLVTYYNGGNNLRFVHNYSLNLYPELEKETGQEMSYHRVNSIRMMESKERMDECMHQMGKSRLYPARQEFVTPEEIKRHHPLVNVEGNLIYNFYAFIYLILCIFLVLFRVSFSTCVFFFPSRTSWRHHDLR